MAMDNVDPLRILTSFGIVLALIGLMALALRFITQRKMNFGFKTVQSGRLQVIESRMIDGRRKMVLIKRDNREHLLLLSADKETVIESFDAQN